MQSKKINDIQVLRGVAIVMVLLDHLKLFDGLMRHMPVHYSDAWTLFTHPNLADIPLIPHITDPLYIGVDLFFVISGYVVIRSLRLGTMNPLHFIVRRVFRLFPTLLAALAIGTVVILSTTALSVNTPPALQGYTVSGHELQKEILSALTGTWINNITRGCSS